MGKLEKLSLKKEVIAKISDDQMNHLRGGGDPTTVQDTDVICTFVPVQTEIDVSCINCCAGCPTRALTCTGPICVD